MKRAENTTPTRDKERTRRSILDAAERTFSDRGANVSIADIATAAGVTKGGLMHHFPSRTALIHAVAEHVTDRMWEEVHAHIDLSENRAGKFTRGYVRAMTGGSDYLTRISSPTSLVASAVITPELDALYESDAQRLNAAFAADGLPHARTLAIRFAAEGVAAAIGSPYLTSDELAEAREELLALTELPHAEGDRPSTTS
jgi:AcrR family transcriptional regulator